MTSQEAGQGTSQTSKRRQTRAARDTTKHGSDVTEGRSRLHTDQTATRTHRLSGVSLKCSNKGSWVPQSRHRNSGLQEWAVVGALYLFFKLFLLLLFFATGVFSLKQKDSLVCLSCCEMLIGVLSRYFCLRFTFGSDSMSCVYQRDRDYRL